jgi:hypothetical protein
MQNMLSSVDGLLLRKSGEWAERKHHYERIKTNVGTAGANMGMVRAKPETIEENVGTVSE